jgi:hypothetical protein
MMANPAVGQAFLTPALQDLVRHDQPSQPSAWPSVACLLGQNQGPCWRLRLVAGSSLWSLQWGQVILPWHHARGYCGDRAVMDMEGQNVCIVTVSQSLQVLQLSILV